MFHEKQECEECQYEKAYPVLCFEPIGTCQGDSTDCDSSDQQGNQPLH
jgi:hypothetical protein